MRPVYRHPDPAYYWAPPNVEGEPIWGEPYNYYRGVPQGWGYGKYEGGSYWHRHRPADDGYYYNGSKYRDQGPQFYERDGRDFGRDFDRGFGRDFSPVYVYPSPAPAAAFRPFHPGEQFRHPDEYPMRFVPVTYGSSGPREMEQVKQHCCGCPNHVCHPETSTGKGVERKCLMDSNTEDAKTKLQSSQELAEPVVWFNPSEWWNRASDSKDQNEQKEQEKEEHHVKWIPVNQNRNEGDKEQIRQFPGYWIPLALNQRPKGGEEEKKIPGYWIPLDLSTGRLGPESEKKNSSYEQKLQPFPVLWIPEGNWKAANPREGSGTKNEIIEEEHKKTNEADGRPVIVQEVGKEDEKQVPVEGGKETKVRDIPVKQLEEGKSVQAQKTDENLVDNHKLSSSRACKLLEVKKEDEKQGLVDGRKETKIRDIPVKQLGEGKSVQAQKTEETLADNHKVSSPRASKLPPVCLRVDPLPGKKKNNGKSSSRSPSPPRKEENTKDNAISKSAGIATPNASVGKNIKSDASNVTEEANLKFPQVFGEEKKSDEIESSKTRLTSEIKNAVDLKASKVTGEAMNVEENLNVKCQQSRDKKTELGRDQAALKIQAFYRGCQVRKLQPLRKLREIANIRKRVEEHKQQILSSEFVGELSRDDKTKGRMSETLMCLLLQLDTIQGLHPVVRDVRKSVARELVQLQEKLDTLVEEAHIGNSHPCTTDMIEDNVTAVQEKIDDRYKGLEATEECGETLITTSTKNQQVAIQISTDDENAREKETYMQGSPEIGNEASNNYREDVFVEKEANDGKEETENVITKYGENVKDNASVQQEALEVSDNLEIPFLSMPIQKAETVNEDENVVNERELVSSVTSEDIISIVNNAGVSLQNVAKENKEKSDPSLENISVENEEKSKPDTPMETDSAPPQGLDAAVVKEICPTPTLDQEQEVAAFDNSSTLDETTFTLEKSGTLEQGGKPVVVMPEAEECDATIVKEICPASTLVQEQEVASSDNWSTLDENADALEKNATLEQGGKVVVIMPEAEPDNKMSAEKDKMSSSEELSTSEDNINKTGSEELQNALTEKTAGVDNLEFNTEAFSQAVSDGLSVSHSDGIDKIKLDKVEKALPAAENLSEMGEFAVAMAQGTDEPIIEKSTIAHITGDGLATMNTKIDLSIQDEEHAPKGKGTSDGTESGASDKVDRLVMESSLHKNDLVHSENISESEVYNTKSVRNQDPEKWEEENENLREMVRKLVEAEKNQMSIIVQLNDKIKQLENKLSKGNGMRKARAGQLRLRSNRVARNSKNATALGC